MFDISNKSSFARQYLVHRPAVVGIVVLLGLIANVLTLMIPISIGRYYELVLGYTSKRLQFLSIIPEDLWNTTERFVIFFGIIILLRFIFFFAYQYKLRNESDRFIKYLKDYLFAHQLDVSSKVYSEKGIGKYLLRYTGDINSIKNLYKKGSIAITIDIAMLIIGIYFLWSINNIGGYIILLSILVGYLIIKLINIRLEKASIEKRNTTSMQVAFVTRILSSISAVKVFNRKKIETKRYASKSEKVFQTAITFNQWNVINSGIIHFIQYSTLLIVLIVFVRLEQSYEFTSASLISFILLFQTLIPALKRLYKLESVYKLGNISESKLRNIVELDKDDTTGIDIKVNNPRLTINNLIIGDSTKVDFKSGKKELCYLELQNSETIHNLLDILSKIKSNYTGNILINKQDIRDIGGESIREIMGISSTHYPLVGKTVYESLVYKRSKDIKKQTEQVFNTFKSLYLPNATFALDDKIGENGSNLSPIESELLMLVRGYTNCFEKYKFVIVDHFHLLESINPDFYDKLPILDKTVIALRVR